MSDRKSRKSKKVCRDFVNRSCYRGESCQFAHPQQLYDYEHDYKFCSDYQTYGCYNESCQLIHASSIDVDHYEQTGFVSTALAGAIVAVMNPQQINGVSICRQFQNGQCRRGENCRYWHVNSKVERARRQSAYYHGRAAYAHNYQRRVGSFLPYDQFTNSRRRPASSVLFDSSPSSKRFASSTPFLQEYDQAEDTNSYIQQLEQQNNDLRVEIQRVKRSTQNEQKRYIELYNSYAKAMSGTIVVSTSQFSQVQVAYQQEPITLTSTEAQPQLFNNTH
ncbi:putative zinc finger protein [Aphelenchoides besseyi]|nr:putative zinc finger protein [Aphelenchoides besseyi]